MVSHGRQNVSQSLTTPTPILGLRILEIVSLNCWRRESSPVVIQVTRTSLKAVTELRLRKGVKGHNRKHRL